MSVYETIKMSPLLGLQGSGGGLAYLAGLVGEDKTYVDDLFSTTLYRGNASTKTITNGIDISGEGGLVWTKVRTSATFTDHILVDSERGNFQIQSNSTAGNNGIASFNFASAGYTVPNNSRVNASGEDYVSSTFRKAPGFFDVVTWTGNGTAGRTIAHNLGSVPGMIIIKNLDETYDWAVYHRSLANTHYARLNKTTAAENTNNYWNSTTATSTHFTLGDHGSVNYNGSNLIAYVFAHDDASFGTDEDESIIKCGTFTSGSFTTNVDINLGFEPQFFIVKKTSATGDWWMIDTMRGFCSDGGNGPQNKVLRANTANSEGAEEYWRPTATGISGFPSGGSNTYIYMAIRRPNKPPTVATDVFAVATGNSSNPIPTFVSNFTVDAAFLFNFNGGYDNYLTSRSTNGSYLRANTDEAQVTGTGETFDSNTGWARNYNSTYQSVMFKRAPGFMDVVTYTGTGSNVSINHNLEVVPEMMIVKQRSSSGNEWAVYESSQGNSKMLSLNTNSAAGSTGTTWNNTSPTNSVFTVGTHPRVNGNTSTYIAYLFATLPGISKVGSYSGTGNAVNVDCGFSNGARFILIKRTDSTGDWYLWDSVRGIVSGNDPYLLLNVNTAQITNTDYVDPLSTGFTVTSSAPAALNVSGGTYLFLAIA